MVGDQDPELDMAMQEGGLQRALAATLNRNGGDMQTSIIDAALEDLDDDDMKFDGITFDQHQDEFTSMPAITGYASMGRVPHGFNNGFNFDSVQRFNYPAPPAFHDVMPNNGYYDYDTDINNNIGFNHTLPMFPSYPPPQPQFLSDVELSRACMQSSLFSSDMGDGDQGAQYPAGPLPGAHDDMNNMFSFNLNGDSEPPQGPSRPLKKRRVDKAEFGSPAVGPLKHKAAFGRLQPIEASAILDMSETAVAAREARRNRRTKRAKIQILHLLDQSVPEIETAAVSDSEFNGPLNLCLTQDDQCEHLLREYMDNFDAKMFVEGLWDGIYCTLSAAEKVEKKTKAAEFTKDVINDAKSTKSTGSVAAKLIQLMKRRGSSYSSADAPDDISSDLSSSCITTVKLPNINANVSRSPDTPKSQGVSGTTANHVVTPTASDVVVVTKKRSLDGSNVSHTAPLPLVPSSLSSNQTAPSSSPPPGGGATTTSQKSSEYPDLPDGNDAESRRLRRLMRNRLSAQRSRDKRRKEIEVYTKLKVQKVEEIASIKKTISEEKEGLKKLEEMVNFAKRFLGPAKFATVVSN